MTRMEDAAAEATRSAGERFSEMLLELRRRKGAKLDGKEQFQAASWACLNRRERRALRRAK